MKDLRAEIADLDDRIAALADEAAPIRKQLSAIDSTKSKLENQVRQMRSELADSQKKPRVSDHAVLRYLERNYDFDFEKVRQSLLSPAVKSAVKARAAGVKIEGGTLKISGNTITTFVGKD